MATAHCATPRRVKRFLTWQVPIQSMLITLIGLAYGVVLVLNIATFFTPPRISFVLSTPAAGQAHVAWVLPGGVLWASGVRRGDAVVTVDGHTPGGQHAGLWVGRRVQVRTATGRVVHVAAATAQQSSTWPLLVLSPWFLLLGMLVIKRTSQLAVGRATYNLFAAIAFAFALAPSVDRDGVAATVAELAAVPLLAAYFVHFFLTFPLPRGGTALRIGLLVPPLLSLAVSLVALGWPQFYDGAFLLRLVVLLAYLVLGSGLLVYSFSTAREREARRGLTIISAGTVASFAPFLALYVAPSLLNRPAILAPENAILALTLLPVSFAYAILRHHVLDVPLLQRWLVYGVLGGGSLAVCTVVVSVVYAWHWLVLPEPWRSLVTGALVILCVGVPVNRIKQYLDRLIFKDSYDYRASLQGLSQDLSAVSDLNTLTISLPATLRRLMNLDFAVLLIHDGVDFYAHGSAGAYQPAMDPALVDAARQVQGAPQVAPLEFGYLNVLFVPLRTHDALVGYLCLGPKSSGEPFRTEDRDLLATLSGHLAAIVRNAYLVDDLRAKVAKLEEQRTMLDKLNDRLQDTQEEERTRLAADIHDEPLQTALHLQRQLAVAGDHGFPIEEYAGLSQMVVDQLRSVCTAMRPSALDDLGLPAALDLLTLELGERASVPIVLDAEVVDLALSPATTLVLYRAAQEALNNSLRHAHAHLVRVTLGRQGDMMELCVADDGIGFTVPSHLIPLVAEGHLGLAGLHERVQRAGGQLVVTSAPGKGTVVRVRVALEGVAV